MSISIFKDYALIVYFLYIIFIRLQNQSICMVMDLKKKEVSDEEIEVALLHKLFIMRVGIKHHIYEPDLPKGFPPHLHKRVLKAAKSLHRKGLLIKFPHRGETVWQLNLDRVDEIKERIKSK